MKFVRFRRAVYILMLAGLIPGKALRAQEKKEPVPGAEPVKPPAEAAPASDLLPKVKVGAGLRASVRATEDAAPNGGTWSKELGIESARLYVNGSMLGFIGFELNTELDADDDFHLLDAVAKIEPHDLFNIWAGRFLPPSDRSNLDGPYYLNVWDFPFVQNFPAKFAGRDDGVAYWGQLGKGMFKWQGGVFEGTNGGPNQTDDPLFAGRLVLNILDPEPGYYNSSTYYGDKDILAVGVTGMYQEDAVGTAADARNFKGFNLDVLFEKKLGDNLVGSIPLVTDGVITVEGAYYIYSDDNLYRLAGTPGLVGDTTREGQSGLVTVLYLIPGSVGIGNFKGRFQPFFRFQGYDRDQENVPGTVTEGYDIGTNFIVKAHELRFTVAFQNRQRESAESQDTFLAAVQLQF
jgi:hypothetical protein